MKYFIVSLRDIKTDSFFPPQFVRTIGGYVRQLTDEINQPQQPNTVADTMSKHPEDFEIYCDGTWDDTTGKWEITETPERICVISSLKR